MYDIVEVAEATPCSAVHLDTPTSTASTMDACVDAPKTVFTGRPTATLTVFHCFFGAGEAAPAADLITASPAQAAL